MLLSNLGACYLQIACTFLGFIYVLICIFIIKLRYFIIITINLYLLIFKYKFTTFKALNTFLTLVI
jgi:hypothetical protein